jgi:hypothetical protein
LSIYSCFEQFLQNLHWSELIASTDTHNDKASEQLLLTDVERKRREAVWELFQSECVFLVNHLMVLKHVRVSWMCGTWDFNQNSFRVYRIISFHHRCFPSLYYTEFEMWKWSFKKNNLLETDYMYNVNDGIFIYCINTNEMLVKYEIRRIKSHPYNGC